MVFFEVFLAGVLSNGGMVSIFFGGFVGVGEKG